MNIDTEYIYRQDFLGLNQTEAATRGGSGYAIMVTPSGLVTFPTPFLSARNITHRAESVAANNSMGFEVLIYYNYIEFSLAEIGFLLARRN